MPITSEQSSDSYWLITLVNRQFINYWWRNIMQIKALIKEFIEDESGLTAVEYAIAGGLVVSAMIGAFTTLGTNATGKITELGTAIGAP